MRRIDPLIQINLGLHQAQNNEKVANDVDDSNQSPDKRLLIPSTDHQKIALHNKSNHMPLILRNMDQYKGNYKCGEEKDDGVAEVVLLNDFLF